MRANEYTANVAHDHWGADGYRSVANAYRTMFANLQRTAARDPNGGRGLDADGRMVA